MDNLKENLIISILVAIMFAGLFYWQALEVRQLEGDIDRFKQEIRYLEGKNEEIIKDNNSLRDTLWHYNNDKMKEDE